MSVRGGQYQSLAVFNWTIEDVLDWLENYVELPQYADVFRQQQITGRQLPSIAINSGQILQNVLSIMDSQHKQKIQLRAMDVVLFGPPAQRGHWKDVILKISVVLIVCGSIYAIRQKRVSKLRMDSFMEDLRLKEEEIRKLKSKFESLEQEAVDGASLSNEGSQEDIQESSLPLMMAPTSSDSSSEDDSASFCKCVQCPPPSHPPSFTLWLFLLQILLQPEQRLSVCPQSGSGECRASPTQGVVTGGGAGAEGEGLGAAEGSAARVPAQGERATGVQEVSSGGADGPSPESGKQS